MLTVQCRIWRKGSEITTTDLCCARTRLKTYKGSFLWPIEEFSALQTSTAEDFQQLASDDRKVYSLKPFTEKGPFIAFILYLKRNSESEDVYVDILVEKGRDYAFCFELSVLDANGEAIQTLEERGRTYFSWTFFRFCPLITKNKLNDDKNLFLPNDTLVLKCSFEVYAGPISNEIEYCTSNVSAVFKEEEEVLDFFVEEMDADDTLEFEQYFIKDYEEDAFDTSAGQKIEADSCNKSCPLKAALRFLHGESTMTDVNLRCGTKLYPVHKNILCSRSPVFNTIFTNDKEENIFEISGMGENTLCRLLQYIYTDNISLQSEDALDLYKAAADYQFWILKINAWIC
ncbi:hypothetical protein HNY73_018549 [Argiope bruennichi]|uniref:BTB domain-containing protein n=1 Tax=Argiope bruennichi TaxID=94029 RepID=A0A8T0EGM4_ARGBR|nr:hypothetical protein HNY73_018549 [Argiope bruennichi]